MHELIEQARNRRVRHRAFWLQLQRMEGILADLQSIDKEHFGLINHEQQAALVSDLEVIANALDAAKHRFYEWDD